MYTAVNGIYENGTLIFTEEPPTQKKTKVVVMFMDDESSFISKPSKGVRLGSLEGKISISDDFNDPIDDLKDYM